MSEHQPSYEDLLENLRQLQRQVEALQAENARLRGELDDARRAGKRQAAPFSKGPPAAQPKRPGRKAGDAHGRHGHRPPPPPDQIDEAHQALLPDACPHCGGALVEIEVAAQYQTDVPRRPVVRRFDIHRGRCRDCGRRVQGRHPLQTSDALGAAAAQLGPDAQAAVVVLNKQAGLSHGKIAACFHDLLGIGLTRGASAQIVLRAGRRCRPAYDEARASLPASPVVRLDETGWKVGGRLAWLHAWVGERATCYAIDPRRGADAAERALGLDYAGVLIHDGFAAYGRFEAAVHQQCLYHLLRRAREMAAAATRGAVHFPRQVEGLFVDALAVRDAYRAGRVERSALPGLRAGLEGRLDALVVPPRQNAANERLAWHLAEHFGEWFGFVEEPELVEATNHRAEQALRPAVVNRKVWGGNRTWAGAEAQAVLSSVLQTCRQGWQSGLDFVSRTLRGVAGLLLPPPAPTAPASSR
jgi:transposase